MKLRWIPTGIVFAMCSTLFLASCGKGSGSDYGSGSSGGTSNPPAANTVDISNMKFSVSSLTVSSGTTVTWINDDDMAHTVTADDNSFNSGSLKKGDKYQRTFSGVGTYAYHCTFHPTMKANVVVNY